MVKRGHHTSLDKDSRCVVKWLEAFAEVTKVILGRFDTCRHKFPSGHLKAHLGDTQSISGNIYTGNGILKIVVLCVTNEAATQLLQMIEQRFQKTS